jgi:hypothetical protein
LLHLSGVVGWSWGWYISNAWDNLTPKGISALLVDLESQAAVLGLLSFHRIGYVRQEAVRLLARETTGDELRYLLIRQNDWVSVIADEAQTAVNRRLVPTYLPNFVRSLPLVVHLLAFRRHDLSRVVRTVVEMLVQPQHDAMLGEIITASDPSVRRQVVRVALEMAGEHHARVIHHGLFVCGRHHSVDLFDPSWPVLVRRGTASNDDAAPAGSVHASASRGLPGRRRGQS